MSLGRVRASDGNRGTARWIGKLADSAGAEDEWVGVEWDNPSRGKHNGEHQGKQLFTVSVPNSGSFVRKSSLTFGESLMSVIGQYKFAGGYLSVDDTNVESVGDIQNFPSDVTTVNASFCLISSLKFIWDLLQAAPKLIKLQIGQNHFTEFPEPPTTYDLENIVLNDLKFSIQNLQTILRGLPHLKSLDLTRSPLPDFQILSSVTTLEAVYLDTFGIKEFKSISSIMGRLPCLKILSLNGNQLSSICYEPGTFMSLESLFINQNLFSDLLSLNEVNRFPSINELRIKRNPLEEKLGEVNVRMLSIASFPRINKLNGSDISEAERRDSEIQYLSFYSKDVEQHGASGHPRWEELCAKYGRPASQKTSKETAKNISVTFERKGEEVRENLLSTITIQTLQSIAARLFSIDEDEIELGLQYLEYETELNYPDQTLEDVGCCDGSIIHVKLRGEEVVNQLSLARQFKLRSKAEHVRGLD